MRWNLRMTAAERGIWKSTELRRRLAEAGLEISAGKMSALWTGTPTMIRLDDLDVICVVLECAPEDLLNQNPTRSPPVARRSPSRRPGAKAERSRRGADATGPGRRRDPRPAPALSTLRAQTSRRATRRALLRLHARRPDHSTAMQTLRHDHRLLRQRTVQPLPSLRPATSRLLPRLPRLGRHPHPQVALSSLCHLAHRASRRRPVHDLRRQRHRLVERDLPAVSQPSPTHTCASGALQRSRRQPRRRPAVPR